MRLLNEKPRLGLERKNPALRPGHHLPNFTPAIGDSCSVASETRWSHEMGRFMSPDDPFIGQDPNDPPSWNLYSYVDNNPLTNIDPDGHDCVTQTRTSDTTEGFGTGSRDYPWFSVLAEFFLFRCRTGDAIPTAASAGWKSKNHLTPLF